MLPPWVVHLINKCTHTETFLPFHLLSLLSLLTYFHVITHVIYTIVSSIYEQGSEINLYRQLIAHRHHHANNLLFLPTLTITILFPSTFNNPLFCFPSSVLYTVLSSRTGEYILLPLLVQAGSTIKAPRKMLHWKWCFILESQLFENQHGSVQKNFVSKTKLMSSPTIVLTFFFFFFLRFAKTLIQCLCFNREILWF